MTDTSEAPNAGTPLAAAPTLRLDRSIVIPAYNEAERLPRSMAALAGHLDPLTTEIVVVDDGSTDHTSAVADRLLEAWPHGRRIRLERNGGKGRAVRTGVLACTGRHVAFVDADSATDSRCLHDLFDALATADVAIGSRALADSVVEDFHPDRALMGRAFNLLVRSATGVPWRDTQCGFKAFRTPVAKLLFALSTVDGFAFDVEVLDLANRLGLQAVEVPVRWHHVEGSKVRHMRDSVRMTADVVRATRSRHRAPIECLDLGPGGPETTEALLEVPDDLVVSWDRGSVEILLPPGEGQARALLVERLEAHGVTPEPLVRSGTEIIDRCRSGQLSIGIPERRVVDPPSTAGGTGSGGHRPDHGRRRDHRRVLPRPPFAVSVARKRPSAPSADLVVEGFRLSESRSVAAAITRLAGESLTVAAPQHRPARVRHAVRAGVPTVLVVRAPLAVLSANLHTGRQRPPRAVLEQYVAYHRALLPYLDDVQIVDLDDAAADLGPLVGRLQARFGLAVPSAAAADPGAERLPRSLSGDDDTRQVHPSLAALLDEAEHLHGLFLAAATPR